MIQITQNLYIDENDIKEEFIHSSGPGGQNVNKVATAVQLRFSLDKCAYLSQEVKDRLYKLAKNRINTEGELVITAKQFRSQEQNRKDALDRLIGFIQKALIKPVRRIPTKPSKAAKVKRLLQKKRHGTLKKTRKFNAPAED